MKSLWIACSMAWMGPWCHGTSHAAPLPGGQAKEWPASPSQHTIVVKRNATELPQQRLIAAAEALAPRTGPWWDQELRGVRIPVALTAEAVAYYTALVTQHQAETWVRHARPASSFLYEATATHHDTFSTDGRDFTNVTVVSMRMKFHQRFTATPSEGFGFEKRRLVLFDHEAKIVHVAGDGPITVPVLTL
jgi:hypothetical protein